MAGDAKNNGYCGIGILTVGHPNGDQVIYIAPDSKLAGRLQVGDVVVMLRERGQEDWRSIAGMHLRHRHSTSRFFHGAPGTVLEMRVQNEQGDFRPEPVEALRQPFEPFFVGDSIDPKLRLMPYGTSGCVPKLSDLGTLAPLQVGAQMLHERARG